MIDTSTVQGRRHLRFDSIEQMLADARACAAADQAGGTGPQGLRQLGNWPLGKALNHVAEWIEYPFVGYPPELVIPPEMKAQARAAKDHILNKPMRPGERLPGLQAGTLAVKDATTAEGLGRLEAAAELLRASDPNRPTPIEDPAFGVLTVYEWTLMSLRHGELHLGFFVPA